MNRNQEENTITFAMHTLGCKVNTYESDLMAESLRASGFVEVPFSEKADIYLVNTCTVTNIADRKSRQMLHRAAKQNPEALIAAAGCYVDAAARLHLKEETGIDLLIGNEAKKDIAGILISELRRRGKTGENRAACNARFLTRPDGHTRAFIGIESGCDMFCTYCIIPYVRGPVVSRSVEDTVEEVRHLSENGFTEIVLTGIHLSSMGKKLLETIRRINEIPGVQRIRLGSLEPRLITKPFVDEISKNEKLCPHFHLSLQSGCDAVLAAMKRRYTTAEYAESCRLIREEWPDAALTTDIIAGFPGETEENFRETLAFAREIGFYEAHIFKYSRRKGTEADRMPNQIPEEVKTERSAALLELSASMSHAFRSRFLGKPVEFLCEEVRKVNEREVITGYTREYVRCALPAEGTAFVPGSLLRGTAEELWNDGKKEEFLFLRREP